MPKFKLTKEQMIELYVNDDMATMTSVAKLLGVHGDTVRRAIKRFGLQSKSPGTKPKLAIPELADAEWLENQLDGKSIQQLANELGVSPGRIWDRAWRHGLLDNIASTRSEAWKKGLAQKYPGGRYGKYAANWRGGRKAHNGYIYIHKPSHPNSTQTGYVFEHRLVIEKALGRYLEPSEIVHHINGIKDDNRLDNLEVKKNGQHITDHWEAGHEVVKLRKEVAELKAYIALLESERMNG